MPDVNRAVMGDVTDAEYEYLNNNQQLVFAGGVIGEWILQGAGIVFQSQGARPTYEQVFTALLIDSAAVAVADLGLSKEEFLLRAGAFFTSYVQFHKEDEAGVAHTVGNA